MKIPIRNLYYLLCYAWDLLPESEVLDVGIDDAATPQDLLARVLVNGVTHLRRRGLMREYRTVGDRMPGVRGKLQVAETLKRNLLSSTQTYCVFDELDVDAVPNQVVKATLRLLGTMTDLDRDLRTEVAGVYHSLGGVSDILVTPADFARIQLHRNVAIYRLLLQVCRFIYEQTIPDEAGASAPFRDFVRDDDQMAALFQRFVLNFFRREQIQYRVDSPRIEWEATAADLEALDWLPRMQTDIVLRSPEQTFIIDTKYYREAFQTRFGRDKIRSNHLYQILSYALNWNATPSVPQGVLLYPTVRQHFDLRYHIQGVPIRVCSVDLDQPWPRIRSALLDLTSAVPSQQKGVENVKPGVARNL